MWEKAQRERPQTLRNVARIAPAGEPGVAMRILGRIYQSDGRTPAPDIVVFAYQTDREGVYNRPGADGWRLRGWAKSDAQGRFEFHTIRPGSYPGSRNPAHVHLTIEGPRLPRRWTTELQFLDDPFIGERQKRESVAAGTFGGVRPVTTKGGTQHVELNLRIAEEGRF